MNTGLLGVALAIAATGPIMGLFLPPIYEVRHGSVHDAGFRETALVGASMAVVVGVVVAKATGNPWPLAGTVGAALVILLTYEWALRNPVGV